MFKLFKNNGSKKGLNLGMSFFDDRRVSEYFEPRKEAGNPVLGVIINVITFLIIFIFIIGFGVLGSVIGLAKGYMETTPVLDIDKIEGQAVNAYIYDQNGELFTTFAGTQNREWASLEEIPENLQNAFIAIEDVRFRYHNGVDFKRLIGAVIGNVLNTSSYGGSTITQQLIKNSLLTSEQTYKRKIQEAYLAIQLEQTYTKDEILESYLNTIPLGGTIYGVKVAAKDYFGKDLDQLTLREAACLAGMNQAPTRYNPRRCYYGSGDKDALNKRIDTVLERMYAENYITKEQYEEALSDQLIVVEKSTVSGLYEYPYFVEYAIDQIIDYLLEKRGIADTTQNRSALETELSSNGYKIYLTIDTSIQDTVQTTLANYTKYPKMANSANSKTTYTNADGTVTETIQPQASAVVYDYRTGDIKAIVGGRNDATFKKSFNRATESTMPVGSAIKPLSVYAPALDKGYSPASVIANVPVPITGWDTESGYPATEENTYGPMTLRNALVHSINIATARTLMDWVGINDSINYLTSLGIDKTHINPTPAGLALGTSGITTLEMAVAYGCIANGGEYITPLAFSKVEDRDGNVILDASEVRETRQVFQESTAYLITDMLVDAVQNGTGKNAKIAGMTVGGKTGTNQENRGVSFSGVTPYYTASVYIGHDNYEKLSSATSGSSAASPLWQAFMSKILAGKENKAIQDKTAEQLNIVQATTCAVSGKLATDACAKDILGRTPITDIFYAPNVPTDSCTGHYLFDICTVSGLLATPYCPAATTVNKSIYIPEKGSALSLWPGLNGTIILPDAVYDDNFNISDIYYGNTLYASMYCQIHTEAWHAVSAAITAAKALIATANDKLLNDITLTDEQRAQINEAISNLNAQINASVPSVTQITAAADALRALIQ